MERDVFADTGRFLASALHANSSPEIVSQATDFLRQFTHSAGNLIYQECKRAYIAFFDEALRSHRNWLRLERLELNSLNSARSLLDNWLSAIATIEPLRRSVDSARLAQDRALFHVLEALISKRLRISHKQHATHLETAAAVLSTWLETNRGKQASLLWVKIKRDELWMRARAARIYAFRYLARGPHRPEDFEKPIHWFECALSLFTQAASWTTTTNHVLAREAEESQFWLAVCRLRKAWLEDNFEEALAHLAAAQIHAVSGKVRFPNYYQYREPEQLESERLLIEASLEFSSGNLEAAAHALESWLSMNSPLQGVTTHSQVTLRHLAIKLLLSNHSQRFALLPEIIAVASQLPPADDTGRFCLALCESLAKGIIDESQAAERLQRILPLDAAPPKSSREQVAGARNIISEEELLQRLPDFFSTWLSGQEFWPSQLSARLSYLIVSYCRISIAYIIRVHARRVKIENAYPIALEPERPTHELSATDLLETLLTLLKTDVWPRHQLLSFKDGLAQFLDLTVEDREPQPDELRVLFMNLIRSTSKISFPLPVKVHGISLERREMLLERRWSRAGRDFVLRYQQEKAVVPGHIYFLKAPRRAQTGVRYDENPSDIFTFYSGAGYTEPRPGRFVLAVEGVNDKVAWERILTDQLAFWRSQIEIVTSEGSSLPVVYRSLSADLGYKVIVVADEDQETKWRSLDPEKRADLFLLSPDFEGIDPGGVAKVLKDYWRRHIVEEHIRSALHVPIDGGGGGGTIARVVRYLERKTGVSWNPETRQREIKQTKTLLAKVLPEQWAAMKSYPEIILQVVDRLRSVAFFIET